MLVGEVNTVDHDVCTALVGYLEQIYGCSAVFESGCDRCTVGCYRVDNIARLSASAYISTVIAVEFAADSLYRTACDNDIACGAVQTATDACTAFEAALCCDIAAFYNDITGAVHITATDACAAFTANRGKRACALNGERACIIGNTALIKSCGTLAAFQDILGALCKGYRNIPRAVT